MVMLLTTADLLMKMSRAHSFSELLCLLCFHSEGGGLKEQKKKAETQNKAKSEKFFILMALDFHERISSLEESKRGNEVVVWLERCTG